MLYTALIIWNAPEIHRLDNMVDPCAKEWLWGHQAPLLRRAHDRKRRSIKADTLNFIFFSFLISKLYIWFHQSTGDLSSRRLEDKASKLITRIYDNELQAHMISAVAKFSLNRHVPGRFAANCNSRRSKLLHPFRFSWVDGKDRLNYRRSVSVQNYENFEALVLKT